MSKWTQGHQYEWRRHVNQNQPFSTYSDNSNGNNRNNSDNSVFSNRGNNSRVNNRGSSSTHNSGNGNNRGITSRGSSNNFGDNTGNGNNSGNGDNSNNNGMHPSNGFGSNHVHPHAHGNNNGNSHGSSGGNGFNANNRVMSFNVNRGGRNQNDDNIPHMRIGDNNGSHWLSGNKVPLVIDVEVSQNNVFNGRYALNKENSYVKIRRYVSDIQMQQEKKFWKQLNKKYNEQMKGLGSQFNAWQLSLDNNCRILLQCGQQSLSFCRFTGTFKCNHQTGTQSLVNFIQKKWSVGGKIVLDKLMKFCVVS